MNNLDFASRNLATQRYHDFLSRGSDKSWIDILNEVDESKIYGLPEVLVLLHPRWHLQLGFTPASDPRGAASFAVARSMAKCRSGELWGYECPYTESKIHIDHTFPFARGGATSADNAMYLCVEHNLSKSTDIHNIPWELLPVTDWIANQLKLFITRAQRETNVNLYLPKAQLSRI